MAAAAMHHLVPHSMRSSHNGESHHHYHPEKMTQREQEKQHLANWEAERQPLEPDVVAQDPAKKRVGHSSRFLRCEDFELIKTLGTGMRNACSPRGDANAKPVPC